MELLLTTLAFFTGIFLVFISVPPIIRVANAKHLFDYKNERKIHEKIVPPMGGVAIFIAVALGSMIFTYGIINSELKYIIAALIIIFFIGLKDDLLDIPAWKKVFAEIVAALLIVILGNIRLTSFHGFLGIYEIGFLWSIPVSLLVIIAIMNAFNLIDGVDGLASGLGILGSTILGLWFYHAKEFVFAIIALSLSGSLVGFFYYNVFGKKYKLFLGDTGALIMGMIIATLIIKFNEVSLTFQGNLSVKNAPVISLGLIIIPIVDTIRVIYIRLRQNRSPFSADNNHIHHRIFYFFKRHIVITTILVSINLLMFAFSVYLNQTHININFQMLILVLTTLSILTIPYLLIKMNGFHQKDLKGTSK